MKRSVPHEGLERRDGPSQQLQGQEVNASIKEGADIASAATCPVVDASPGTVRSSAGKPNLSAEVPTTRAMRAAQLLPSRIRIEGWGAVVDAPSGESDRTERSLGAASQEAAHLAKVPEGRKILSEGGARLLDSILDDSRGSLTECTPTSTSPRSRQDGNDPLAQESAPAVDPSAEAAATAPDFVATAVDATVVIGGTIFPTATQPALRAMPRTASATVSNAPKYESMKRAEASNENVFDGRPQSKESSTDAGEEGTVGAATSPEIKVVAPLAVPERGLTVAPDGLSTCNSSLEAAEDSQGGERPRRQSVRFEAVPASPRGGDRHREAALDELGAADPATSHAAVQAEDGCVSITSRAENRPVNRTHSPGPSGVQSGFGLHMRSCEFGEETETEPVWCEPAVAEKESASQRVVSNPFGDAGKEIAVEKGSVPMETAVGDPLLAPIVLATTENVGVKVVDIPPACPPRFDSPEEQPHADGSKETTVAATTVRALGRTPTGVPRCREQPSAPGLARRKVSITLSASSDPGSYMQPESGTLSRDPTLVNAAAIAAITESAPLVAPVFASSAPDGRFLSSMVFLPFPGFQPPLSYARSPGSFNHVSFQELSHNMDSAAATTSEACGVRPSLLQDLRRSVAAFRNPQSSDSRQTGVETQHHPGVTVTTMVSPTPEPRTAEAALSRRLVNSGKASDRSSCENELAKGGRTWNKGAIKPVSLKVLNSGDITVRRTASGIDFAWDAPVRSAENAGMFLQPFAASFNAAQSVQRNPVSSGTYGASPSDRAAVNVSERANSRLLTSKAEPAGTTATESMTAPTVAAVPRAILGSFVSSAVMTETAATFDSYGERSVGDLDVNGSIANGTTDSFAASVGGSTSVSCFDARSSLSSTGRPAASSSPTQSTPEPVATSAPDHAAAAKVVSSHPPRDSPVAPPRRFSSRLATEQQSYEDMMQAMCMICLEKLSDPAEGGGAKLLGLLDSCKHRYCYTCILEWSKVTNKCPQCKARFHTIKAVKELRRGSDRYRGTAVTVADKDQTYDFVDVRDVVVLDPDIRCHTNCFLRRSIDARSQRGWEFSVQCEQCSNWFHGLCVGFNDEQSLPDRWFCGECGGQPYPTTMPMTPPPSAAAGRGVGPGRRGGGRSSGRGRVRGRGQQAGRSSAGQAQQPFPPPTPRRRDGNSVDGALGGCSHENSGSCSSSTANRKLGGKGGPSEASGYSAHSATDSCAAAGTASTTAISGSPPQLAQGTALISAAAVRRALQPTLDGSKAWGAPSSPSTYAPLARITSESEQSLRMSSSNGQGSLRANGGSSGRGHHGIRGGRGRRGRGRGRGGRRAVSAPSELPQRQSVVNENEGATPPILPEPPAPSLLDKMKASHASDLCEICGFDTESDNLIVYCESCNMGVHQTCYGISEIPSKEWYCSPCTAGVHPRNLKCRFCPVKGGALKRCTDGRWGHILCAFWIPECCFLNPRKMEPIGSINTRGQAGDVEQFLPLFRTRKCQICGTSAGCAIRCYASSCKFHLHPMCGSKAGNVYMEIETDEHGGEAVHLVARCPRHHKGKGRSTGGSTARCVVAASTDPLSIFNTTLEVLDPEQNGTVVLKGKVTWFDPVSSRYCILESPTDARGFSAHWISVEKLVEAGATAVHPRKSGRSFVVRASPSYVPGGGAGVRDASEGQASAGVKRVGNDGEKHCVAGKQVEGYMGGERAESGPEGVPLLLEGRTELSNKNQMMQVETGPNLGAQTPKEGGPEDDPEATESEDEHVEGGRAASVVHDRAANFHATPSRPSSGEIIQDHAPRQQMAQDSEGLETPTAANLAGVDKVMKVASLTALDCAAGSTEKSEGLKQHIESKTLDVSMNQAVNVENRTHFTTTTLLVDTTAPPPGDVPHMSQQTSAEEQPTSHNSIYPVGRTSPRPLSENSATSIAKRPRLTPENLGLQRDLAEATESLREEVVVPATCPRGCAEEAADSDDASSAKRPRIEMQTRPIEAQTRDDPPAADVDVQPSLLGSCDNGASVVASIAETCQESFTNAGSRPEMASSGHTTLNSTTSVGVSAINASYGQSGVPEGQSAGSSALCALRSDWAEMEMLGQIPVMCVHSVNISTSRSKSVAQSQGGGTRPKYFASAFVSRAVGIKTSSMLQPPRLSFGFEHLEELAKRKKEDSTISDRTYDIAETATAKIITAGHGDEVVVDFGGRGANGADGDGEKLDERETGGAGELHPLETETVLPPTNPGGASSSVDLEDGEIERLPNGTAHTMLRSPRDDDVESDIDMAWEDGQVGEQEEFASGDPNAHPEGKREGGGIPDGPLKDEVSDVAPDTSIGGIVGRQSAQDGAEDMEISSISDGEEQSYRIREDSAGTISSSESDQGEESRYDNRRSGDCPADGDEGGCTVAEDDQSDDNEKFAPGVAREPSQEVGGSTEIGQSNKAMVDAAGTIDTVPQVSVAEGPVEIDTAIKTQDEGSISSAREASLFETANSHTALASIETHPDGGHLRETSSDGFPGTEGDKSEMPQQHLPVPTDPRRRRGKAYRSLKLPLVSRQIISVADDTPVSTDRILARIVRANDTAVHDAAVAEEAQVVYTAIPQPTSQEKNNTLALRGIVREQLENVLRSASQGGGAVTAHDRNEALVRIATDIEKELFERIFAKRAGGGERAYKLKYKQLLLSLGNVRNDRLVGSVMAGSTAPADLATKDAVGLIKSLSSNLNVLAIPLAGRNKAGLPSSRGKGKGKGRRGGRPGMTFLG